MLLRGSKIFARCDESGELMVESGRVEIRYRKSGKAYGAAPRNLEITTGDVLPDDDFSLAEAAPAKAKPAAKKKKAKAKSSAPAPTIPPKGEVLAYCDGACSGNPGPAGLGSVIRFGSTERRLSEFLGHGTNNIAELKAIQRIAEAIEDKTCPVHIYTDSSYSIGLLQKGWKAKANQDLVAEVRAAMATLKNATLHHVKGHAGHELNELADTLAVQAVESRSTTPWIEGPFSGSE
ncbi:MAG: ribonuclease HI [Polyangiales bacterium]|jgi:ribonuclease HI